MEKMNVSFLRYVLIVGMFHGHKMTIISLVTITKSWMLK